MKRYVFLLPVVLVLACSQSKFKGSATTVPAPAEVDVAKPVTPMPPVADKNEIPKKSDEATIPKKDGGVPKIPDSIYSVGKFGANFEDFEDKDYNDAVLCFKGSFELNTTANTIVSLKDQDVKPETFSAGDCHHDITVEVFSASGASTFKETFPSRPYTTEDKNPPANAKVAPSLLKFKKGDKLNIKMKVVDGVCDSGVDRTMQNKEFSRLLPDVCYGDY